MITKLKTAVLAGVFAASALAGTQAVATTYTFDTPGPDVPVLVSGGLTVTAYAEGLLNFCGANVAQTSTGLGVNGCPDIQPDDIDGFPLGSKEGLRFDFASAVILDAITFSNFGFADDYNLYIDDVLIGEFDLSDGNPLLVGAELMSFAIEAVGDFDFSFFKPCFNKTDGCGNDAFRVLEIQVSQVPLPASVFLMLAGLGGLAVAKRRTKRA